MNPKILVVDDDTRLRHLIERYLSEQDFTVRLAQDGREMNKRMERENFDLIILDLMLPDEDGLNICRRLRADENSPPILMLTAKSEEIDRILGLEMGADDYLPKPFNPRELLARIRAILRRVKTSVAGAPSSQDEIVAFGPFALHLGSRNLYKGDKKLPLSTGEFAVLKVLVTHPRQALSRDQLMNLARGREYTAYDRTIDTQISRLRRLLEDDPSDPRYIQTVWGLGYTFIPDEPRT